MTQRSNATPIIMLHGMYCTAAVWEPFRTFFEARGTRVHTPTLRPELRVREQPPRELRALRLDDYIADAEREARTLESETGIKPAVLGHSMGGILAQALAARGRVSAAVLIAPSPPAGVRTLGSALFWTAASFMRALHLGPDVIRPERRSANWLMFNAMPQKDRDAVFDTLVYDSVRAFADTRSYAIDESGIEVPVLTVAGKRDRSFPIALTRRTARKYARVGGDFLEYDDHAHWLLSEPGWEKPAADIHAWLERRCRPEGQSSHA